MTQAQGMALWPALSLLPLGPPPTRSGDSEHSQCHLPAPLALNEVLSPCLVAQAASNLFPAGSRALLRIPTELSLMGFNFNLLLLENTDGDPPLSLARAYTG